MNGGAWTRRAHGKVGWTWTRAGWKRITLHMPGAEGEKATRVEAPKIAAGQGEAQSAPKVAPKAEKLAPRQMRAVWSGKYDAPNSEAWRRADGRRPRR